MYLTPSELTSHLYRESLDTISREDEAPILAAIDAAISEARGYLTAYDTHTLFAAEGEARNALLLLFVKDIAVWHFVNLCNAGTDLDLREKRYDRAVSWLRQVQKGEVVPDFPIVDKDGDGKADGAGAYIYGSNPKRNLHI